MRTFLARLVRADNFSHLVAAIFTLVVGLVLGHFAPASVKPYTSEIAGSAGGAAILVLAWIRKERAAGATIDAQLVVHTLLQGFGRAAERLAPGAGHAALAALAAGDAAKKLLQIPTDAARGAIQEMAAQAIASNPTPTLASARAAVGAAVAGMACGDAGPLENDPATPAIANLSDASPPRTRSAGLGLVLLLVSLAGLLGCGGCGVSKPFAIGAHAAGQELSAQLDRYGRADLDPGRGTRALHAAADLAAATADQGAIGLDPVAAAWDEAGPLYRAYVSIDPRLDAFERQERIDNADQFGGLIRDEQTRHDSLLRGLGGGGAPPAEPGGF